MKTAQKKFSTSKGFTLIELLVVITIIATLAVTVFVALNPSQRLKDSKDARRTADVDTILTAIHAALVDSKGVGLSNMPAVDTEAQLGSAATGCALTTSKCTITEDVCANLMGGTNSLAKYLKSMPIDPTGGTYDSTKTGYSVKVDANGMVTVKACGAEGTGSIEASR